jgi:hypothetical protein
MRDKRRELVDGGGPRHVAFIYASKKRQVITKSVSNYDLVPTVLKALHIVKEPKNPFGLPVDEEGVGFVPTWKDYLVL